MQLAAHTANATRLATWQTLRIYGEDKKVKNVEPPEPILPPWDRTDADADDQDGTTTGPITEDSEAGTRRFGSARMTTAEVDAWLGWGSTD